jgi:sulfur carrier protein ThiS
MNQSYRQQGIAVKTLIPSDGKIAFQGVCLVKLILRNKEYEVKPGMTLLSALQKINVVPESVIATREGEMILEDEILKDGDVVKLIAVISGG